MQNVPLTNLIKHIKTKYGTKAINHYLDKEYPNKRYKDWQLWEYLKNATSRRNTSYPLDKAIIDRKIFKIVEKKNSKNSEIQEQSEDELSMFQDETKESSKHPRIHSVSRLFKKIRQFSVRNYLIERKLVFEWLFLKSVQEEKPIIYEQAFKNFEKYLTDNSLVDDEMYHCIAYQYYWEKYRLDNAIGKPQLKDLELSHEHLQKWYDHNIGLLNTELHARNTALGEQNKPFTIASNLEQINTNDLIIKIQQLNIHKNESFDVCMEVFKKVHRNKSLASPSLLENILSQATIAFREGNSYPLTEYWSYFHEVGITEGLLFENGKLPIMQYMNLLSIYKRFHDDELDEFAVSLLDYISDIDEPIAIHFKDIFIAFHNQNFEEALFIINKNEQGVKTQNLPYLKLRLHTFKVRSHYELELIHYWKYQTPTYDLNNSIRSLKGYLQGADLTESQKQGALNFLKVITKICRIPNVNELNKLKSNIHSTQPLIHEDWLLKKVEEAIEWSET